MFTKKTIRDIDLKNKTVLLRTDYNVPLKKSQISDDYRITQSLDTINYLISQNCKIVICSHLGRPLDNKPDPTLSLFPVAKRLKELLNKNIEFTTDCIGQEVQNKITKLDNSNVLLLENLRFHKEEELNDPIFAEQLSKGSDIFIQDAFGVVHRSHASTSAITKFLPSVSGLLLQKEVDTITETISNPSRPLMTIVGGAKIADKLEVLNQFIKISDILAIGGAMANTFLMAEGLNVGSSVIDREDMALARDILDNTKKESRKRNFNFFLPFDAVVASDMKPNQKTRIVDWSSNVISDIENYPKRPPKSSFSIQSNEKILDIGPFSGAFYAGLIQLSKTVVWNGTLGVTEVESYKDPVGPFSHGTDLIIQALVGDFGAKPFSLVGGGDTVGYIENRKLVNAFNHVSTGGGASLELMSGHKLPGIENLLNR